MTMPSANAGRGVERYGTVAVFKDLYDAWKFMGSIGAQRKLREPLGFTRIVRRLLRANTLVDFLSMNRHVGRSSYADAHLVAIDAEYRHRNIAPNPDSLADTARKNEHLSMVPC